MVGTSFASTKIVFPVLRNSIPAVTIARVVELTIVKRCSLFRDVIYLNACQLSANILCLVRCFCRLGSEYSIRIFNVNFAVLKILCKLVWFPNCPIVKSLVRYWRWGVESPPKPAIIFIVLIEIFPQGPYSWDLLSFTITHVAGSNL